MLTAQCAEDAIDFCVMDIAFNALRVCSQKGPVKVGALPREVSYMHFWHQPFWAALDNKERRWIKRRIGVYSNHKLFDRMIEAALSNVNIEIKRAGYGDFNWGTLQRAFRHSFIDGTSPLDD